MIKEVAKTIINNLNVEQGTINILTNDMKITRHRLVTVMKTILLLKNIGC